MNFKNLSFFDFAGSLVGGTIFLAITIFYASLVSKICFPNLYELFIKSLDLKILNGWLIFTLLSLSFVLGYFISSLSVNIFYYSAKKKPLYTSFKGELQRNLDNEKKIPDNDDRKKITFEGQMKMMIAFANNTGHPFSLYGFAGRARLFGSATLNLAWNFALSVLCAALICCGDSATNLGNLNEYKIILLSSVIFSSLGLWISIDMTLDSWIAYLKRVELFTLYEYKDGKIIKCDDLFKILGNHSNLEV
ncbi:MAG: hypothetical protein AAF600_09700 [Bacteroidota bacterium]